MITSLRVTATKNHRVRGMLLKSGKQFSLDSHIDIENTVGDQERVEQLSRILGMKCAWIENTL